MVIKNLENKVKLVTIICSLFLVGCVLISISSIWTAKNMVVDAQNKIYVLEATYQFWCSVRRWMRHWMWKQRAISRCSIIISSHWHQMTSTSNTRWRKPCIWWMRQDWRSTIR